VIGPLIGGAVAALTYDRVARPDLVEPVAGTQGTQGEVVGGRRESMEAAPSEAQGTQGEVTGRRR
jgi:hypothetical protein